MQEEFVGRHEYRDHGGQSIGHHGLHRALAGHQGGHDSGSVSHGGDVRANRFPGRLEPADHAAIGPDAEGNRASLFSRQRVDRGRLNGYRGEFRQGGRHFDRDGGRGGRGLTVNLHEDRLGLATRTHHNLGLSGADRGDGSSAFHDDDGVVGGAETHPQNCIAVAIERLNGEPLLLSDHQRQGIGADI